jgi:maltose alpha-D-glucosyltransferase/alpha-amylase
MQWNGGKNLGFSTGNAENLYLPVDPSPDAPNVADQESNPESLLNKTRQLIALHHSEPALANYAEFVPIYPNQEASSPYPFVYARAAGKDCVLVMLNPKAEASDATFNINVKFNRTKLLAGDKFPITHNKKTGEVTIHMPATSYAIVKLK